MNSDKHPTSADVESANTLGTVACPLLAGFSITLIGIIAGQQSPQLILKFPDMTLAVLLIAVISFILSIQYTVAARKFNLSAEEYKNRTNDMTVEQREKAYDRVMDDLVKKIDCARIAFNFGICSLLLGLTGVTIPPEPTDTRMYISLGMLTFFLCESVWLCHEFYISYDFSKSLDD